MQQILLSGDVEIQLNWPVIPEAVQQQAIDLWALHNALPPEVDPRDRASQVVAIATDQASGEALAIATVQPEQMGWVGQPMFRYRTFAVADARLRSISVQMVNCVFDFLNRIDGRAEAGLYMEIENQFLMQHQNEGTWFESRCSFIGYTPQGWHKRVRFFPNATLPDSNLQ